MWNKFIGVDHFYLIDNNSEVPLEEIFEDFLDDVTIIKQPEKIQQMDMYNDLYVKYKSNCTWMAFLDDDEFLFNYASKSLNIKDFFKYVVKLNRLKLYHKNGYQKYYQTIG